MKRLINNWGSYKRFGVFLILLPCLLLISFELYALVLVHIEGNCPLPENFGNFERVTTKLEKDRGKGEFLFGKVGDTKGCGTFERIYEKLQNEPLAFLVLLGDCVRKGTRGYRSYFRAEWKDRKVPYPVFYVVCNHDVDQKRFSVSRFEQAYGPTNFYFQYRNNLFVCLRILDAPYSNEQSLNFLENMLAKRRFLNKRVFLFMHIPPTVSPDYHVRSIEGEKRFVSLINKYHVDYVIGSDFHGYAGVKVKDTMYLVTGGGGAHLKKVELGPFHHGIVFGVKKDSVLERILFAKRDEDLEDQLERYVLAEFIPWLKGNKPLAFIAKCNRIARALLLLLAIEETSKTWLVVHLFLLWEVFSSKQRGTMYIREADKNVSEKTGLLHLILVLNEDRFQGHRRLFPTDLTTLVFPKSPPLLRRGKTAGLQ